MNDSSVENYEPGKRKRRLELIFSLGLTVISGVIYVVIYIAVPGFNKLFISLGSDLPFVTKFVLNSYLLYGMFFLVGLIPYIMYSRNRNAFLKKESKYFNLIVINFVLSLFVIVFVYYAMYLPIFEIASSN